MWRSNILICLPKYSDLSLWSKIVFRCKHCGKSLKRSKVDSELTLTYYVIYFKAILLIDSRLNTEVSTESLVYQFNSHFISVFYFCRRFWCVFYYCIKSTILVSTPQFHGSLVLQDCVDTKRPLDLYWVWFN